MPAKLAPHRQAIPRPAYTRSGSLGHAVARMSASQMTPSLVADTSRALWRLALLQERAAQCLTCLQSPVVPMHSICLLCNSTAGFRDHVVLGPAACLPVSLPWFLFPGFPESPAETAIGTLPLKCITAATSTWLRDLPSLPSASQTRCRDRMYPVLCCSVT